MASQISNSGLQIRISCRLSRVGWMFAILAQNTTHSKVNFFDAPISQGGLLGNTVVDFAQQFLAVKKQTYICLRRDSTYKKPCSVCSLKKASTCGSHTSSTIVRAYSLATASSFWGKCYVARSSDEPQEGFEASLRRATPLEGQVENPLFPFLLVLTIAQVAAASKFAS